MVLVFVFWSVHSLSFTSLATRALCASLQTAQHASDTLDSEYEKIIARTERLGLVTTGSTNWLEKPCKCARRIRLIYGR